MSRKSFATLITSARTAAGLTQREAAAKAGVSQPYWAMLETGVRDPGQTIANARGFTKKLARAVGVKVGDLLPPL